MEYGTNPLTGMDFPDPDIIRAGDTYYMISTTMHFFPGGQILRSYDLIHWEICSYVYGSLEHTPGERMEGTETIYGHGMWAASLRYHNGKFYAVFIAHEWNRTFLFTAEDITGPWKKSYIEGIYHDPSLLFDDDGKVYIVYGNRNIRMTELKEDLSAPKPGGFDRIIIRDAPADHLGYEGSHIYKINGKYVLFLIHSLQWKWHRTQACFITDDIGGVWAGGDVMCSDLDGMCSGPAQGGVVDTPDGKWFSVVFQDRGAVGRVPVLVPVTWNKNGYPVYGSVTKEVFSESTRSGTKYAPLYAGDDFSAPELKNVWQFNHEPHDGLWQTGGGRYTITTDKISPSLEYARNTLTQRTVLPGCTAEVTVDASDIREGDTAGLCLLIGSYGLIGITKEKGEYFLVMRAREKGSGDDAELSRVPFAGSMVRMSAKVSFEGGSGEVRFFYDMNGTWEPLGGAHKMNFTLDHFVGCRFGLYLYATKETGGSASFGSFEYIADK